VPGEKYVVVEDGAKRLTISQDPNLYHD